MSRQELQSECERIVQDLETRVERFMAIEDGEPAMWLNDGVQSVILGFLDGKSVEISIHVQPGPGDAYWGT